MNNKHIYKILASLILLLSVGTLNAQSDNNRGCPGIDAGPDTVVNCINTSVTLKASVFATSRTVTQYAVKEIPYAPPYPYTAGTPVPINNTDDIWATPITMPFGFCFYGTTYNTNGKQQINWIKLACDSTKIDLLPFFEKAGMLRPIHAYIEDYGAGWNIITEEMIDKLKTYVKEQGYPAFTEEINYINAHNYHIYRDSLKLEVPTTLGKGCSVSGNKGKVNMVTELSNGLNLTMLADFYELTMANGYFKNGFEDTIAYFDMFFRKVPDKGGFAIFAGLSQIVEYLKNQD